MLLRREVFVMFVQTSSSRAIPTPSCQSVRRDTVRLLSSILKVSLFIVLSVMCKRFAFGVMNKSVHDPMDGSGQTRLGEKSIPEIDLAEQR